MLPTDELAEEAFRQTDGGGFRGEATACVRGGQARSRRGARDGELGTAALLGIETRAWAGGAGWTVICWGTRLLDAMAAIV